jgi:glycosyltransferase involved in cell wall biosynthesis
MRIAFVVNDADTGGAQTLVEALSLALADTDEVHVIVLLGRGALSERLGRAAHAVHHLGIDKRSYNVVGAVGRLRSLLRRIDPDVVHSHLLQADLLAILATAGRTPLVSTVHTTGMSKSDPLRSRLIGVLLGRLAWIRTARVIACGSGARAYAARYGYPLSILSTIDNGTLIPSDSLTERSPTGRILTLARWHPMKDYPNLLRAFKETLSVHPEAILTCAGSGTSWENRELCRLIDDAEVPRASIRLLGVAPEPRTAIAAADVLVIASSYGEALPMAGIEALAVGTPVVSTDLGDCRRLTMEADLLVPPRDPGALGHALTRLLDRSPEEYRALQQAGRAVAARDFDIAECARAHRAVYVGVTTNLKRRRWSGGTG